MLALLNSIAPIIIGAVMVILLLSIILLSKEERHFEPRKVKTKAKKYKVKKKVSK